MGSVNWTADFVADLFTDRLCPTNGFSFYDPVPTKCSFGRGRRQEEIPIPRMPQILLFKLKENVFSVGRGIQRKPNSSQVTKPGMAPLQSESDQKTNLAPTQENFNFPNPGVIMEPLFFDQNCSLLIPSPILLTDQPVDFDNRVTETVGFDMKNEDQFPSLSAMANKDPTSKQNQTKSQKKKKNKKKS